jgi:hypothetical protein
MRASREPLLNRASPGKALKAFLFIFKALILDSRVVGLSPSLTAAPEGPETRPLVSANAARTMQDGGLREFRRSVLPSLQPH